MVTAKRPKMAALLEEPVFEISGQGPAPSKDFFQLLVTKTKVIWRWWKISLRSEFRNTVPGELKESHQDFVDDSSLQVQVSTVFGVKILVYTRNLCQGHFDYLDRLSEPLLLRVISFLDLEDVARLAQTSQKFKKLCNSEEVWEQIVERHCDTVTPEMRSLAKERGWKEIFFCNKLQLQMHISRKRLMQDHDNAPEERI
ncbi:F-box only protein 36 [Amia ocellicauda]|uniref:F-box only protein 36 n=1 Tax=Amia ocellicauda TaxID=2972642 RepID=UPI0034644C31